VTGPWLQHPDWLTPAALGVAAAALAILAGRLLARRRRQRLLGPRAPRPDWGDAALLLGLGALAVALLGPRLGMRSERVEAAGADVVLLLDVSRSMTARDTPPSRLDRARRTARDVLAGLGTGDRVALAAYAGHGVLLTPLSADAGALAEMLPFLDPDLVGTPGSRLDDGVLAALSAFDASDRPRVLLVLSDGEDPARGDASTPGVEAARAGARVVSVAFGSESGAPIPDGDTWLRDHRDRQVRTRREPARLARLAEMTDGVAFRADGWGEVDVASLVSALRRDVAPTPGSAVERRVAAVRVVPFALLACLLLALEATGLRPGRRVAGGTAALALLAALGAASPEERALEAQLRRNPGNPQALLQLGIARAERGRNAEAKRALAAAALRASDPKLAAVAYHDLGVVALSQGDLESARDAFLDAVALAPERRRSVYNLEWTLAALAERTPPPPSQRPDPESQRRDERPQPTPSAADPDPLTPEEARRWLESVRDDARRGLRAAGRDTAERTAGQWGPGW
jgi:Ca-activated chloride channel family protein